MNIFHENLIIGLANGSMGKDHEGLSSIPRTHIMDDKNQPLQVVLGPSCVCCGTCMPHIHMCAHPQIK